MDTAAFVRVDNFQASASISDMCHQWRQYNVSSNAFSAAKELEIDWEQIAKHILHTRSIRCTDFITFLFYSLVRSFTCSSSSICLLLFDRFRAFRPFFCCRLFLIHSSAEVYLDSHRSTLLVNTIVCVCNMERL